MCMSNVHSVPRRTKLYTFFRHENFNYLERLKALGISSLERSRLERDLILCYNLFHGICEIRLPFKLGVSVTRGNSCKLVKTSCNTHAAKYFYTNRIIFNFIHHCRSDSKIVVAWTAYVAVTAGLIIVYAGIRIGSQDGGR